MSTLASYRRLLELAGPLYFVVAFFGRLPLSMSQLGTLLLVSSVTDSYATGGLAAGVLAVANAVGAPVAGALADRFGQRPVLLVQSGAGAAALAGLVSAAEQGAGGATLVAAAALSGMLIPQVGPLSRARWRPMLGHSDPHRERLLNTAFSYDGAADEAAFVLGPAAVGILVAVASPSAAVVAAAVGLLVFGTAFALHPTARRRPVGWDADAASGAGHSTPAPSASAPAPRVLTPVFVALLVALLSVGALFGATQTGTSVLADASGQSGLTGLVHATLGIGSVIAGLGTALLPASFAQERRMVLCAGFLLVFSLPLLLVDSLGTLTLVVLALGFGVAPFMISAFTLGERTLPPGRFALGLSLLGSSVNVGYAVGAGIAGRLADHLGQDRGHTAAFAVTVSAMVVAVLVSLGLLRRLRRLERGALSEASAPETAHPLLDVR
ncbi:MFS transporter [Nocardioides campestrisoli]|uniref:MFS transporter n=1 Tax=Nocardioides campestrisoli TaxID=2736757 RepID=UPI0015E71718|nr:MFS transporter [Nocardioides campestrisoli]